MLVDHIEQLSKMAKRELAPVEYLMDNLFARGASSILAGGKGDEDNAGDLLRSVNERRESL